MTAIAHPITAPPALSDMPFDVELLDLDDIVPYADAPADVQLAVLQTRRAVGELFFQRQEDMHLAGIHDAEASLQEKRADAVEDKGFPDDAARIRLDARRNRLLAQRSRWRSRHRELEIMAHLRRKEG